MNYNKLPDAPEGNVKPGEHLVEITSATREISKKGKQMLTLKLSVVEAPQINITDHFALFNQENHPESFGQYKLKKLLEAVEFTPEDDFTIQTLVNVLPNKRFIANLEHEEGLDGRKYLGVGHPDKAYMSIREESTEETGPEEEEKEAMSEVTAALTEDDDIV